MASVLRSVLGCSLLLVTTACVVDDKDGGDDDGMGDDGGDDGGDDSGLNDDSGVDDSGADDSGTEPPLAGRLELVVDGLVAPTDLVFTGDDASTVLVLDQPGQIYRIVPDAKDKAKSLLEPFADLSGDIVALDPKYDERGLLGGAAKRYLDKTDQLFVFYTVSPGSIPGVPEKYDHANVIVRYDLANEDKGLDLSTSEVLWGLAHPYMNHNGGSLAFWDELLYVSLGDGGNKNDIGLGHNEAIGNGQDRSTQLGKILRLDVSGDEAVAPTDNPYYDDPEAAPEIFAYGFRNPSSITFDPESGELFAADAGQDMMEEVDQVQRGENYGWNVKEGTLCFNKANELEPLADCADEDIYGRAFVDPILTFANASSPKVKESEYAGHVVVGGAVVRNAKGSALEDGDVVFASFSSSDFLPNGELFVGRSSKPGGEGAVGTWTMERLDIEGTGHAGHYVRHISSAPDGTIYVLVNDMLGPTGNTGAVYRLVTDETK